MVQPKHQHVFVQYHWFARRLGAKHKLAFTHSNFYTTNHWIDSIPMVILMVYRISMPWLCTLECVHTMQRTVQYWAIHYTHCTAHHKIKDIDRGKKNIVNNWKGSWWTRFLDGSGYSNCRWFFPKSHILTIRFCFMILANSIYFTKKSTF